jgi:hypothetical protein
MQESPGDLGNPKCDTDADMDNITDSKDNCRAVANADQLDTDGDGIGDMCDPDLDGDGVKNLTDNCPKTVNPDQADVDRDARGDACDARYCYVVNDDEKNCLDPQGTFRVYSPMTCVQTGKPVRLRLFANRTGAPIQYRWIVEGRPDGSEATVENPTGIVHSGGPGDTGAARARRPPAAADGRMTPGTTATAGRRGGSSGRGPAPPSGPAPRGSTCSAVSL